MRSARHQLETEDVQYETYKDGKSSLAFYPFFQLFCGLKYLSSRLSHRMLKTKKRKSWLMKISNVAIT